MNRLLGLVPVVVVLVALDGLASCGTASHTTPEDSSSGTAAAASRTPMSTPPTPRSAAGSSIPPRTASATLAMPSTVPPAPPAPVAMDTDFHDPIAVARAWMTQWCATDYRQPRNNNVERATVYATTAGKTADLAAGDTTAGFLKAIERKLAHRCDQLTAEISTQAPRRLDSVFVVLTARRTLLSAGQPVQSEHVSTTRAVLRQPDGRWLVDRPIETSR